MPRAPLGEPDESPGALRRTSGRFHDAVATIALIGGVMAAIGIVLMVVGDGAADFIGVVLASLAVVPTVVGFGLELTALTARRASREGPFA